MGDSLHHCKLQSLCRTCGNTIKKKTHPASTYKEAILKYYNITIDCDNISIHPKQICDNCRRRLTRVRGEDACNYQPECPPVPNFMPHTEENCWTCKPRATGRPRKRKLQSGSDCNESSVSSVFGDADMSDSVLDSTASNAACHSESEDCKSLDASMVLDSMVEKKMQSLPM